MSKRRKVGKTRGASRSRRQASHSIARAKKAAATKASRRSSDAGKAPSVARLKRELHEAREQQIAAAEVLTIVIE